MADVQHSALTGATLHEPKGAAAASAGEVYIADGAASGAWATLLEFGHIYTQESDSATLSTIGTTVKDLPFTTNGANSVCVADSANNRITLTSAGTYYVTFSGSVSTVAAGDSGTYKWKIALDSTPEHLEAERELSGSGDLGDLTTCGLITATAGQQLTVEIESDEAGDSDDLNLINLELTAIRLGV